MDREDWQATVHSVAESDTTKATYHACSMIQITLCLKNVLNSRGPLKDKNSLKSRREAHLGSYH